MTLRRTKAIFGVLACLLGSSVLLAVDVPLKDWEVRQQGMLIHSPDGMGKAVDISVGIGFVAITPCRVVDTRPSQGFPAAWGPPILAANVSRNFDLDGAPHCTGFPVGVGAYSVNFTIAEPSGPGDLRAYPQGIPPVTPTSIMNWSGSGPAFAIANSAVIPAGTGGGITVQVAGTNAHLIIDINGYFSDQYNLNNFFSVVGTYNFVGGLGYFNNQTTTLGWGVRGVTSGASDGATGVHGRATGTSGYIFGVKGITDSSFVDSAGVKGVSGEGDPLGDTQDCSSCYTAGVRGVSDDSSDFSHGVLGVSRRRSTSGILLATTGTTETDSGYLGYWDGVSRYAGRFFGNVAVNGNLSATGVKPFVEPHRTDASKEIAYIALEGSKSEIYFRGTASLTQGVSRIELPEHFRMVARPGSFSTLVTPVGAMATVAVLSESEDGIVIQASRNVKAHYVVYAERAAFADFETVRENTLFRPESDEFDLSHFPAAYREILIKNGTLTQDGKVNRDTARRLGWSLEGKNKSSPAKSK